jgi:exosome complex RNA-binding protein Rrp42 (RNase PH superfamily)
VIPLESLCIEEGKAVWVLYCDVVCINYDGNALDASIFALMTALSNGELGFASHITAHFEFLGLEQFNLVVRLPKAEYDDGIVRASAERLIKLDLPRFPFGASFIMFDG